MNKKLPILLSILVIVALGSGYYLYLSKDTETQSINSTSTSSANIATTKNIAPLKYTGSRFSIKTPIRILDSLDSFSDTSPISIMDKATGTIVSFKGFADSGSTNPGSVVYVNTTRVGDVEGIGLMQPAFSPDGTHFSFIETSICGASCEEFNLYILNLKTLQIVQKPSPATDPTHSFTLAKNESPINDIVSYQWSADSSAIDVKSYLVFADQSGQYRISPIQIWRYDLTTQNYTLVQTLSE